MASVKPTVIDETQDATEEGTPGQLQYVPILPGETLQDIATKYGTTIDTIVSNNNLNPDYIFPNQWIFV